MGLLEDLPELFPLMASVVIGVGSVAVTVLLIFRFGLGKQRTFEEAKAMATRKADLVLQEEYKNSPRNKKGKKQFPRKKKHLDEGTQDQDSLDSQSRKSILKPAGKEQTPERSPRNKVGFSINIDEAPKTTPRPNPPTPHPSKAVSAFKPTKDDLRTVQPLFEEPEEEVTSPTEPVEEKPPTKTPGDSSSKIPSSKVTGNKKKPKAKKEIAEAVTGDPDEGFPVSRIAEIVGASPLSDDDIQQLVSVLLEKMNTNSEWEAANLRSESVKSLRKQNQDLQGRCVQAEQTVLSHNNKIKELRAEIQNEKLKQQSSDTKLQAKLNAHSNELAILKTRLSGAEEESKQLKALSSAASLKKAEDDTAQLRAQIHQLTTQCQTLTGQLKQANEVSDENATLKTELARAKDAYKQASAGAGRPGKEVELESLLGNMEEEKQQLQVTMQLLNDENSRLKIEADSNVKAIAESEQLKTRSANLEASNGALTEEIEQLRNTNNGTEYEDKIAQVRGEYTDQLEGYEVRVSELEEECDTKDKEVQELTFQIEKCSTLQDELNEQLTGEQTQKKELAVELESLKQSTPNGTGDHPDGTNNEELSRLRNEKDELAASVSNLEKKLTDIKEKNNELRESLWKGNDKFAAEKKELESKVKQAYMKTEALVKEAKLAAVTEAQDAHRIMLTQLFPTVTMETTDNYCDWVEIFETKAQTIFEDQDTLVSSLQEKVVEFQENEQKSIQEAENFRQTLETTMGILERLQSEVEGHDADHKKMVQEKEEMIDRERTSNRGLQAELLKERDATSTLKDQAEESKSNLTESQRRLEEAEHQHDLSQKEAETLRHSLKHELEMKDKVQEDLEQLQEKQSEIEVRLTASQQQSQKDQENVTASQQQSQKDQENITASQQQSQKDQENITKLEAELDQLKNQLKESAQQIDQSKAGSPPRPEVHSEV